MNRARKRTPREAACGAVLDTLSMMKRFREQVLTDPEMKGLSGQEMTPEFRAEVAARIDFNMEEMKAAWEWLRSGK